MLNAFKIKPFELEPIYAEWKDGPVFAGNPKKDLPVDEWLEKIKQGCVARGVPEEYWYKVAQHFMGPKAKARLDELKQVITKVHGGKYRWTWKKFKLAMLNMGWNIDADKKETIKVQGKGSWFMRRKDTDAQSVKSDDSVPAVEANSSKPRAPSRSNSIWSTKNQIVEEPEEMVDELPRAARTRSATTSSFWPSRMSTKDEKDLPQRPGHQTAKSDMVVVTRGKDRQTSKANATKAQTIDSTEGAVTTTQAPAWLLNACTALEYITNEHPKAMSIISAILITAGSIPAMPAIAAGAGGAVLSSGAAHAIGAIVVGVGEVIGAGVVNAQKKQQEGSHGHNGHGGGHH
ncbi:hypothetical protein BDN70DRAFT_881821 [Pholiota conissans]|uniref:Uncharacterized protein n=1 Tax=Pholiota conissans TaxID=109636 RepID=A0A9P6CS46_9AGAR|nr:hypothetical protein BDN70DRAFT_881821 [Pholiota conissans]